MRKAREDSQGEGGRPGISRDNRMGPSYQSLEGKAVEQRKEPQ